MGKFFGDFLDDLCEPYSVREFAERAGIAPGTLQRHRHRDSPKGMHSRTFERLAHAFGMTPDELLRRWHAYKTETGVRGIPIRNEIPGIPARDYESKGLTMCASVPIDPASTDDSEVFAVRVTDDAMSPKFSRGQIVVFAPNMEPEAGEPCFVELRGDKPTFRYVERVDADHVRLMPHNLEAARPFTVRREKIARQSPAYFSINVLRGDLPRHDPQGRPPNGASEHPTASPERT